MAKIVSNKQNFLNHHLIVKILFDELNIYFNIKIICYLLIKFIN
jgi:hypothetical protein